MKRVDITGKRFGALTVLRPVPRTENPAGYPGWLVRCDCGREKIVNAQSLREGRITSCGHIRQESSRAKVGSDIGLYGGAIVSRMKKTLSSPVVHGITRREYSGGVVAYRAILEVAGKRIYLGQFSDYESAVYARREAEKRYYLPIIADYEESIKRKGNEHEEDS